MTDELVVREDDAMDAGVVTLPTCGICAERRACANCQDAYGCDGGCGMPICRRCRDEGPPEGAPGPSFDALFRGFDPMMPMMSMLGMFPDDYDPNEDDDE